MKGNGSAMGKDKDRAWFWARVLGTASFKQRLGGFGFGLGSAWGRWEATGPVWVGSSRRAWA